MESPGSKLVGNKSVLFRPWAPLANQEDVVSEFNNWQDYQSVLSNVGKEYWERVINNIRKNDIYKYIIHQQNGELNFYFDPATKETIDQDTCNAKNHGVVNANFDWSPFTTPLFDDLIIYQCHIGSFSGRNDGLKRENRIATFLDTISKLDYIKAMGFNAIALLPVFKSEKSVGFKPSIDFLLESSFGKPVELKQLVNECHERGLAVIFDVVYNHINANDNSLLHFEDDTIHNYLSSFDTPWGLSLAFWQDGIKDLFLSSLSICFDEFNADGIRFDATCYIENKKGLGNDGWEFMQYLTYFTKMYYPDKYLIAEHIPSNNSIVNSAGIHAARYKSAYECVLNTMQGNNPVENLNKSIGLSFGYGSSYTNSWNLFKYMLGSHNKSADTKGNNGHRYYIDLLGGRDNYLARSKARMVWALNISFLGTPMLFMGNECNMSGYWHDCEDKNGDHRFDWSMSLDEKSIAMRKLVTAANTIRCKHPSLRTGSLEITHKDHMNNILAFKRWDTQGDIILTVLNLSDTNFTNHSYSLITNQSGRWQQILCSQDVEFGGWSGAGNAFYDPFSNSEDRININIPQWSVLMFKLL
jgi:1,4-alpha-glucan branching enzyme